MKNYTNTYKSLPSSFWQEATPTAALKPQLIAYNEKLASFLNLDKFGKKEIENLFSGFNLPKELSPISMAYSGHQFGHFVPTLGDGRAILLFDSVAEDGNRYDIQLKGCGRTPFSRRGDGKSSLGPVIREYLLSEAMYSLGVPTTRALCALTSGDEVFREETLPGGIFTRVARSHIRVGTFEYFASRKMTKELRELANYLIERVYPDLQDHSSKYLELYRAISKKQLDLVTKWMGIGFIHGVMNTDNTSLSGETIDYGPCAFMDYFEFDKVYSFIDRNSRYAYNNQGQIIQWNLSSLANCFIPLIAQEEQVAIDILKKELEKNSDYFDKQWISIMGQKIGLKNASKEDLPLINEFLMYLQDNKLDFTNTFRDIPKNLDSEISIYNKIKNRLENRDHSIELMNSVNPVIIPRNHLVEKCIEDSNKGNYKSFNDYLKALLNPFDTNIEKAEYLKPPKPHEVVPNTFCGT